MIVPFVLAVQEIATMKCKKENYLDFMTKLFMDNDLHLLKHVCQKNFIVVYW